MSRQPLPGREFAHMSTEEKMIWQKAKSLPFFNGLQFFYDVRVGDGLQYPEGATEMQLKIAEALTTKRIDVVGIDQDTVHIIEVKVEAGLSGIGQLVGYQLLYRNKFDYQGLVKLWYVTNRAQSDIAIVAAGSHITLIETGE